MKQITLSELAAGGGIRNLKDPTEVVAYGKTIGTWIPSGIATATLSSSSAFVSTGLHFEQSTPTIATSTLTASVVGSQAASTGRLGSPESGTPAAPSQDGDSSAQPLVFPSIEMTPEGADDRPEDLEYARKLITGEEQAPRANTAPGPDDVLRYVSGNAQVDAVANHLLGKVLDGLSAVSQAQPSAGQANSGGGYDDLPFSYDAQPRDTSGTPPVTGPGPRVTKAKPSKPKVREAGARATRAVKRGPTGSPPATQVATPPGFGVPRAAPKPSKREDDKPKRRFGR